MPDYTHILSRCFVNVPFADFFQYRHLMTENRLRPEIGLEGDVLFTASARDFSEAARLLKIYGLRCTLHAPFSGLAPGSQDRDLQNATRNKLRKAFELIAVFEPVSIVCHLDSKDNRHGQGRAWLDAALETWQELLAVAEKHGTRLMLENTYELGPALHREVFTALHSPSAGFCLDVGHVNAFAGNTWQDWLPALAPWLGQLHLHDNHGDRDSHLAPGQGCFDFAGLFTFLREKKLSPIITLEPHTEEGLWQSLDALDAMGIFE